MRSCLNCGKEFIPTGCNQKFCTISCRKLFHAESMREYFRRWDIEHGRIKNPGVGRGGSTKTGIDNPNYQTGIGIFADKLRPKIKAERVRCERCNKDLSTVGRYEWAVHHRDHDRTNNDESNLELLCKKCHQIEHDCHKAFEGVTTIPKGSTGQETGKRPASSKIG